MDVPTILATGLACLDVMDLQEKEGPRLSAGGFSNALILLKTQGWNAIPAVDLGNDRAGDYVYREFMDWNLDIRFVDRDPELLTPIYVLRHRQGEHYFGKECPHCHIPFPRYSPISLKKAESICERLPPKVQVFYFDKVSSAAILLAEECKRRSALVVFEPNRIDDPDLFQKSVQVADWVKYSRERRSVIHSFTNGVPVPLEMETAGSDGLQYRIASEDRDREWISLPSIPVRNFVDASGAGDCLTASLLHTFGSRDTFFSRLRDPQSLQTIFMKGQESSAQNCQYAGARSILYQNRAMLRGNDYCPYCQENSSVTRTS